MRKKFIYTIAGIAVVILAITFLVILPLLHPPTAAVSQYPFFKLVKISNTNYSRNGSVQVYFLSWYGCPLGAIDSWGLYIALSKYGILNVTPNYSDLEAILMSPNSTFLGKTPGLLFVSYKPKPNSNVIFHAIYFLGRIYPLNSTASLPNGTIIKYSGSSLVNIELNEIKKLAPSRVYNLVYKYEIKIPYKNGAPVVYFRKGFPHAVTALIITGPNGTWMMLGYDRQILYGGAAVLAQYASEHNYNISVPITLLNDINTGKPLPSNLNFIYQEASLFSTTIQEAMG